MSRRAPPTEDLLDRLAYRFATVDLLDEALTHVSAPQARGRSYQRLEFLGDRVLGLAVSELLYETFPEASEGELSRRLAELVRRESCAEIAAVWDVGPHVKIGLGEATAGERRNPAILADVCESIIGAVFLDGGYDAAKALIARAFADKLSAPQQAMRDPKSALQEWAQGRGLPTPTYGVVEQTGPHHAPRFRVMVKVKGAEATFGLGPSKRMAEQAAARSLLLREGVWTEDGDGATAAD